MTDRPTDTTSYRDATAHLEMEETHPEQLPVSFLPLTHLPVLRVLSHEKILAANQLNVLNSFSAQQIHIYIENDHRKSLPRLQRPTNARPTTSKPTISLPTTTLLERNTGVRFLSRATRPISHRVGRSVRPSVGPSVGRSVRPTLLFRRF